jgi:hypothetical protein
VCTTDGCNSVTGPTHVAVNTDDGNLCTTDGCNSVTGIFHTAVNTNDNNACTTDGCNSASGVFHNPVTTDDGNSCTTDGCNTATGVTHVQVNTSDGNACTTDGCNSFTGIFHNPVVTNDNNACTTDGCNTATGVITNTPLASINDNNACTIDACNSVTGSVTHNPVNIDDGNSCTTDACNSVTGVSHVTINVNDNNACTVDACNSVTGITHNNINTDDGNVCTVDGCITTTGVFHTSINTDDGNLCTTDGCNSITGIFHNNINTNDNNACTTDGCNSVTGVFHNQINISDNNVCTTDGCNSLTGITHVPVNTSDNNLCTNDGCHSVTGVFNNPINIDDGDPATVDACNSLTGVITHTGCGITVTTTTTPVTCAGNDGTASVVQAGYTYLWTPGNFTTQAITGLAGGIYTVTATNTSGCSGTATAVVASSGGVVTPPGPITGPAGACRNQSGVVYCVPNDPNVIFYQWTLPSGATGVFPTNCITVNFGSTFSGGSICVKAITACGTSQNTCINVPRLTVAPGTPAPISGIIAICPLETATYSVPLVNNATSYSWTGSGGLMISNGQGSNSVEVQAPAGFISGTLRVRSVNCIGQSTTRSLTITGKPGIAPTWFKDDAGDNHIYGVCGTTTHEYEIAPVSGAGCWTWTAPPGAVIDDQNGNFGNPLTVATNIFEVKVTFPPGFTSGNVTVTACNSCANTPVQKLFVQSTPESPGPITGPANGVCKLSGQKYSIAPVPGATRYQWTVPPGAVITSSNSGTSIFVWFTPSFTSGEICVTAENDCGLSDETCMDVVAVPGRPGFIYGNGAVCKSQNNIQYVIATLPNATSYQWSISGGATIAAGQNTNFVTINFNSATSTSAVLSVVASNACGSSLANSINIAVDLNCRVADEAIVTTPAETEKQDYILPAASELNMNVYPNPTQGLAMIAFNATADLNYQLLLTDMVGNIILSEMVNTIEGLNLKEINLDHVAKGMYFVTLYSDGNEKQTLRLIVQ